MSEIIQNQEEYEKRVKPFQAEFEIGMKELMAENIMPVTFCWAVCKRRLAMALAKKYGLKLNYKHLSWKKVYKDESLWRFSKAFMGFYLYWLFPKPWMIKAISRIGYLPRLFSPQWYYKMDGHLLFIDEKDWRMTEITKDYTLKQIWEPETTKVVKEQVTAGQTVIDIGASIGYFTLLLARQVGETGRVFSFEPTDGNFKYLQHNIKKNGYSNVSAHQLAVSDRSGMRVLAMPHSSTKTWAQTIALDDFLEVRGIHKIDFIKLDVDGMDLHVLKGLERTIERSPNLKMTCEYYPKYLAMFGTEAQDFLDFLNKYFTYSIIEGDYEDVQQDHCNFYCVRKK